MCRGQYPTEDNLKNLKDEYPLSEHARTICRIHSDFQEPLDFDVSQDDDKRRVDSDADSKY